ncbi:hypothetical protein [Nonomuraea dietziae]|uniref:hypothetical protein n=1 Tax=Nonomuraea dietziae TaxID=65515 RepID=UPI0031DE3B5B
MNRPAEQVTAFEGGGQRGRVVGVRQDVDGPYLRSGQVAERRRGQPPDACATTNAAD